MSKKADRGTKRVCGECDNKFYDLGKSPIICPMCETEFVVVTATPKAAAKAEVKPAEEKAPAAETKVKKEDGPDIVSLDEVAAAEEGDVPEIDDDDADIIDLPDDDDADIPDADDDDTFLETDDDEDTDVTGIISAPVKKVDES